MDDKSLERLAERVETKSGSEFIARHRLQNRVPPAVREFVPEPQPTPMVKKSFFSVTEYVFIASAVFFLGAATYAGLEFYSGSNTVSAKNVSISISGPTSVRAGDELSLEVVISNHNSVAIRTADLFLEFPQGTRSAVDVTQDYTHTRASLDTIAAGASITRTFKAVVFGARGAPINVSSYLTYRVPSSNAVLRSDGAYSSTISSAPVALTVSSLKEAVSGQPVDITVTASSNAAESLTNLILIATYPPGFQFISSTPNPTSGSTVWNFGTLSPGNSKSVTLRGVFTGEDGDDRVIHFTTGTRQAIDDTAINAPLASNDVTLKVARPFLSTEISIGGSVSDEHQIDRGKEVEGVIRWSNNLPTRINDAQIELKLSGAILDRASVRTSDGFYRSIDSTILFSKETDPRLASVEPGVTNESHFVFSALPLDKGVFKSSQIQLSAVVRGQRPNESGVVEAITSSAQTRAVVATDISLVTGVQATGGPVPPKVDTPTAYTVSWSVKNSSNTIANAVVVGTLPSYVQWKSGQSDAITYNASNRTVTWNIGDMNGNESRAQSFTIAITPSLQQVKTSPALITGETFTAFDRFVRNTINRNAADTTTASGTTLERGTVVP